jgi:hypothetical protein
MVLSFIARPENKRPSDPEGHARRAAAGAAKRAQLIISVIVEEGGVRRSADLWLAIISLPTVVPPCGGTRTRSIATKGAAGNHIHGGLK